MSNWRLFLVGTFLIALSGCTSTKQFSASEFRLPEGDYSIIVMRPQVEVSLLTAGGMLERRADWTEQAREYVLDSLLEVQVERGGQAKIATSHEAAGGDPDTVVDLDRLHTAVGRSIQFHKYMPGLELPTKKNIFDWTLGESAVAYGQATAHDYALFLLVSDSFASGGRQALQAVSFLGCVVGICYIPPGGTQTAFVSLVDLKTGRIVWYNYLSSIVGDIRTSEGAEKMVRALLKDMAPPKPKKG